MVPGLTDYLLSLIAGRPVTRAGVDLPALLENSKDPRKTGLYPLLYHELKARGEADIPDILQRTFYASLKRSTHLEFAAKALFSLLSENHIDCMEIKGQDLERRFYPAFGTRPQTDIDVLIRHGDIAAVRALLPRHGYQWVINDHSAYIYRKDGVQFDLHLELFNYRTTVLLGEEFPAEGLIRPEGLSPEMYFLLNCVQYVKDGSGRNMPAVDLMLGPKTAIGRPGASPFVSYAHHDLLRRTGQSPFMEATSKRVMRFVLKEPSPLRRQFFLLRHSGKPVRNLLRILFPPARVIKGASYTGSRLGYGGRMLGRLFSVFKGHPKKGQQEPVKE